MVKLYIISHIGANKFNEYITNTGLSDLPMGGKRFTGINKFGSKLSKLDRILVSGHYLDNLPQDNVLDLTSKFSDHSPLLLINHFVDYGPIAFKFYNSLLSHNDFHLSITTCWASTNFGPSSRGIL